MQTLVYELAVKEGAEGDNYDERIRSLKGKLPRVDPTYFDTLLTIQDLTSSKVHENALDRWESKHLSVILATLVEVLTEIYVVPAVRAEKRQNILSLRDELLPSAGVADSPTLNNVGARQKLMGNSNSHRDKCRHDCRHIRAVRRKVAQFPSIPQAARCLAIRRERNEN